MPFSSLTIFNTQTFRGIGGKNNEKYCQSFLDSKFRSAGAIVNRRNE